MKQRIENTDELKKEIIHLLRKGKMSTTDIAYQLKEHYWKIFALLEKMRDVDKTIYSDHTKYFIYWKLQGDKDVQSKN